MDWTSNGVQFEYILQPRLYEITPSQAITSNQPVIRLFGENFYHTIDHFCHFSNDTDTQPVQAFYVTASELRFEILHKMEPMRRDLIWEV